MPDYTRNPERFAAFYQLQRELTAALARRPELVRDWLAAQRMPTRCSTRVTEPNAWRTARLSGQRHSQLRAHLAAGDDLGPWLIASLPLGSLFDIASRAEPEAEASRLADQLVLQRESLFRANLGLAKAAAGPGRPDEYGDRLTAACCGLLDAIDRYVPGEGSARFAYFAAYWIRYHIGRFGQKFGSVVAFPIHQQRVQRREGQPQFLRPSVVSFQAPACEVENPPCWEHLLHDPAPAPYSCLDGSEVTARIGGWLRRSVPPATRVMLAFAHAVGPLPDAAADYLAHLREIARERLHFLPSDRACPPCPNTMPSSPPASALPLTST